MAKKGIRYAVFGKLNTAETAYTDGKYLSPVVNFNGTPNNNSVKDYGDDSTVEVATETTGATLSIELNYDDTDIYQMLLGHTVASDMITYSIDDEAPFVGVGAVGYRSGGGKKWRAKFYTKVKFQEPNDENTTKEEGMTFNHITLEGECVPNAAGVWKIDKEFSSLAEAKTWLNAQVGIAGGGSGSGSGS